jgi:hypothetical protein
MHIGASAAFLSPNLASRSAEEWISEETSRAEAAPAPEVTAAASSFSACGASCFGSADFFGAWAPMPVE